MSQKMTAAEAKFISKNAPICDQREVDQLIDGILGLIQKEAAYGNRTLNLSYLGFGLSRDKYRPEQRLAIYELIDLGYVVTYNHVQSPAGSVVDDYSITISWE